MTALVTWRRQGRIKRASGHILTRYENGSVKCQPTHSRWNPIIIHREELDAGGEKAPLLPRSKPATPSERPKRTKAPKPTPEPLWKSLVSQARAYQEDSRHDLAIPLSTSRLIAALADQLEHSQTLFTKP